MLGSGGEVMASRLEMKVTTAPVVASGCAEKNPRWEGWRLTRLRNDSGDPCTSWTRIMSNLVKSWERKDSLAAQRVVSPWSNALAFQVHMERQRECRKIE